MEPDIKSPVSPDTPLFPLSPSATNARMRPALDSDMPADAIQHVLSPSPSLSALPHLLQTKGHLRNSSDVQGKVAQFNGLAKEAAQRRKDNEAALKRAILGREEAEGETKRFRESNDHLRKEIEEGRGRERRLLEKAEEFKENYHQEKEAHTRERDIFDKEVRRSRKDAFKSSSQLVACQEELRNARNKFTLMREDMQAQKRLKEENQAQLAETRIQLAALEEDLITLKQRLDLAEEEKKALKATLDAEAVARAASEGSIALPALPEGDEFASPRKRRRGDRESAKENTDPQSTIGEEEEEELIALKEGLRVEKRLRTQAQDEAHFLKMECQFEVCSCRIAEQNGQRFIHDNQFSHKIRQSVAIETHLGSGGDAHLSKDMISQEMRAGVPIDPALASLDDRPAASRAPSESATSSNTVVFSPNSGTFRNPSAGQVTNPSRSTSHAPQEQIIAETSPHPSTPPRSSPPTAIPSTQAHPSHTSLPMVTPRPLPIPPPRTILHTTTTTVATKPAFDDPVFSPAPNTPGGISREEALERIRARRGRARSFAVGIGGTPGRAQVRNEKEEGRVISAPVMHRH